jgi:hypothetical protein
VKLPGRAQVAATLTRGRFVGALILISVVVAAAGCGGSGGGGPEFDLATIQKCLDADGLKAVPDHNTVLAGTGGNLRVDFGYGSPMAFIVFGKNESEAKQIADHAISAAQSSSHLDEKTIRAGVQQTGNVFYYSNTGPLTEVARSTIGGCLTG